MLLRLAIHVAASQPSQPPRKPSCTMSASTGIRASLRSVIVSVALGAVKVISGVVGHSYALIADGVESMLDVVSGAIVAGSLKIAAQPPDEKYPFGYGKVEPAAALVIAIGPVGCGGRHRHSKRPRDSHSASCAGTVHARRACGRRGDQGVAVSFSDAHGRIDRQQRVATPTPGTIAAIRSLRWPRSSAFRSL